jgi:hypothetical protein
MVDVATISERTMVMTLHVSQMTMHRKARAASEQVVAAHGTSRGAARVNKTLFPENRKLQQIQKQTTVIRKFVHANSMPWMGEQRIIKNDTYLDLTSELAPMISDWRRLADEFCADYEAHKADAAWRLGSLYDADDYPSASEARRRFDLRINFLPTPNTGHFITQMSEDYAQEVVNSFQEAFERQVHESKLETYSRLSDAVGHLVAKLSDPKAVFRNSTIENVSELCAHIDALNLDDDPEMTRLAKTVETLVDSYNIDTIRKDTGVREKVAKGAAKVHSEVDDIMEKMAGLMGG